MATDTQIVRKAKNGDVDAMRELYQLSFDSLYRYVRFKVESDMVAEDLTAEAFVRGFESLSRFRGKSTFKTYVYSIAKNLLKAHYTSKNTLESLGDVEVVDEESSGDLEPDIKKKNLINKVKKMMVDLSQKEQDVLELRFLNGMSVAGASKVLKMTKSNVKVISHRAIKKLKSKFSMEGND